MSDYLYGHVDGMLTSNYMYAMASLEQRIQYQQAEQKKLYDKCVKWGRNCSNCSGKSLCLSLELKSKQVSNKHYCDNFKFFGR